jgi:hypothetical protein
MGANKPIASIEAIPACRHEVGFEPEASLLMSACRTIMLKSVHPEPARHGHLRLLTPRFFAA